MSSDKSRECEKPVLKKKIGSMAVITINRPNKLNSLNMETLLALSDSFDECSRDADVGFVVLEGSGEKAFCAGGDVRAVYERGAAGDIDGAAEVFRLEFDLDYYLANYPKPIIALMDGITMGGGVGLTIAADFKIVTERTRWAMPEMKIGLFPDVGTSYYLSRLTGTAKTACKIGRSGADTNVGSIGKYLCITSRTIGADDCLYAGLADFKIESSMLDALKTELGKIEATGANSDKLHEQILRAICASGGSNAYRQKSNTSRGAEATPCGLEARRNCIDKYFNSDSISEIVKSLNDAANADNSANSDDERIFAEETLGCINTNSPTSMAVVVEQHKRARNMDLKKCFEQDYTLVRNFLKNKDFYEGVRALLVDKTGSPAWSPDKISQIDAEAVKSYFY